MIQSRLGAVIVGVKVAEGSGIAASVLIVALIWSDKRKVPHLARTQVRIKRIEVSHICQAVPRLLTALYAGKVRERVVFHRVQLPDIIRREWRIQDRKS